MSEFQYYEFRAVDRPLTKNEMDEMRALSSRAEITSTLFTNEYSYGGFRGDERKVLAAYYDVMFYIANWGTRRLMFRLPKNAVDVKAMRAYENQETLQFWETPKHLCLDMSYQNEDGEDWLEGEGMLGTMPALREDLLAGDYRPLYVAWLAGLEGEDEETIEPPVPAGFQKLHGPLEELCDFLMVDETKQAVAAAASPKKPQTEEDAGGFEQWLRRLPEKQKTDWLLRLVGDEGAFERRQLQREYRQTLPKDAAADSQPRRTVDELLKLCEKWQEIIQQRNAEAREKARLKKEADVAAAREKRIQQLKSREETAVWNEIDKLIDVKRNAEYDRAAELIEDMKVLMDRAGSSQAFAKHLERLREKHAGKKAFWKRLKSVGK